MDNGAWGIRGSEWVTMGTVNGTAPLSVRSQVKSNGWGSLCYAWSTDRYDIHYDGTHACDGGGILGKGTTVFATDVRDNDGPGILASGGCKLRSIDASDNMGDGVYCENGLYASQSWSSEPYAAEASGNRGYNWTLNGSPDYVHPTHECAGGGLFANSGTVYNVEVRGNGGPGIMTAGELDIHDVEIEENLGSGISAVGVLLSDSADGSEIAGNFGSGIVSGERVTGTNQRIDVLNNGDWGILAGSRVALGTPMAAMSIAGNGKGTVCYEWQVEGSKPELERTYACDGGGLMAPELSLLNTALCANWGPGILVSETSGYEPSTEGSALTRLRLQSNGSDGLRYENGVLPTLTASTLEDNGGYGVMNLDGTKLLNATGNYWGSADGPGGAGSGSGEEVSEWVDFQGFLAEEPADVPTCPPLLADVAVAVGGREDAGPGR